VSKYLFCLTEFDMPVFLDQLCPTPWYVIRQFCSFYSVVDFILQTTRLQEQTFRSRLRVLKKLRLILIWKYICLNSWSIEVNSQDDSYSLNNFNAITPMQLCAYWYSLHGHFGAVHTPLCTCNFSDRLCSYIQVSSCTYKHYCVWEGDVFETLICVKK
jgi:hypothetical protein